MTDEREMYLRRAEEVIRQAESRGPVSAPPKCRDCLYHKSKEFAVRRCSNPVVVIQQSMALAEGAEGAQWVNDCEEQRKKRSSWTKPACGPLGVLFEPKPPSLWKRFTMGLAKALGTR